MGVLRCCRAWFWAFLWEVWGPQQFSHKILGVPDCSPRYFGGSLGCVGGPQLFPRKALGCQPVPSGGFGAFWGSPAVSSQGFGGFLGHFWGPRACFRGTTGVPTCFLGVLWGFPLCPLTWGVPVSPRFGALRALGSRNPSLNHQNHLNPLKTPPKTPLLGQKHLSEAPWGSI